MISVATARELVTDNTVCLAPVTIPLKDSLGKALAGDIIAHADVPAFAQSAMDGYAFSFEDWHKESALKISGEMAAGAGEEKLVAKGEAIRIFTGAPVPSSVNTVVMQEKTRMVPDGLLIEDELLIRGANIRPAGSEIKKGELALKAGNQLTPAAIGFLAGIGLSRVTVYPDPAITVIITGDELQEPGEPLGYGQVYESNSYTLSAALANVGLSDVQVVQVKDNAQELTSAMERALKGSDLVLLTGGVSVGDYDFVIKAAADCKVQTVFHKIKQRPGKPLFFGKKGPAIIFGLPGNPSSVLTCFYMYVLPALELLTQRPLSLKTRQVPLVNSYTKQHALTHFLKGWYDGAGVRILDAQESYRLSSFAQANCLAELGVEARLYSEGEDVVIHLL
ncbi:gephyrin-like molybdotransferase Glp [Niabella yanshanensis]|uniref:Molybdopterin molybdenumtransferase n=1 Tax=Niabella yanshanensis TaxID=577386 RepID=A0ABZ0W569_9BACT|nr:gephyrin-like molybdotransferase Glp [Niabella yanshanensis]WQD37694.1 gephyrin-like molybdotransferase Glp [Niabella yanshanensis]